MILSRDEKGEQNVTNKLMLVLTPRAQSGAWTSLSFFFLLVALTSFFFDLRDGLRPKGKKKRSAAILLSHTIFTSFLWPCNCQTSAFRFNKCERSGRMGGRDNGWKKGTQLKGDEGVTFLTKLFSFQEWRWQPNRGWSWCGLALCS